MDKTLSENKFKNSNGYTLIEVLMAVAIFAIGFLAVGLMQVKALNNTNTARRTTEALALLDGQVERLRGLPFYADDNGNNDDGVWGTDEYDVPPDLAEGDHGPTVAGPYAIRWTIEDDLPLDPYPTTVFEHPDGGPVTRSKTIVLWVTPNNNANDILAEIEFAKFKL